MARLSLVSFGQLLEYIEVCLVDAEPLDVVVLVHELDARSYAIYHLLLSFRVRSQ